MLSIAGVQHRRHGRNKGLPGMALNVLVTAAASKLDWLSYVRWLTASLVCARGRFAGGGDDGVRCTYNRLLTYALLNLVSVPHVAQPAVLVNCNG